MVQMKYDLDIMHAMSDAGIISAYIDGRGTGFKGRKYRAAVSKKLGYYETLDQIAGAKYLSELPFVDENRIAIWGWVSYLLCLINQVVWRIHGIKSTGSQFTVCSCCNCCCTCYRLALLWYRYIVNGQILFIRKDI
jgi:hypothetical protein